MSRTARALAAALLSAALMTASGCGGAGITLSGRPQLSAEVSVLGIPTPPLRIGPRPDVRAWGYQNGYVLLGASGKKWVWGRSGLG